MALNWTAKKQTVMSEIVQLHWLSAKPRRKLPKSLSQSDKEKQRFSLSVTGEPVALDSCSTQTEEVDIEEIQLEYNKAVCVLQLAKFAQKGVDGITDEDMHDDDSDFYDDYDQCIFSQLL